MKENLDPTFNGVFDLLLVATDTVETGKEQGIILYFFNILADL